jgi:type 1 glutamine amidotransferase
MELSPEGRAALERHVTQGGGLLGMHTASICFDTWPEWGQLLGAQWHWGRSHHPDIGDIHVDVASDAHPIVDGIQGFDIYDEIYHHLDSDGSAPGLLSAEAEEGSQPLMWARQVGAGRAVYDSLGHDVSSLENPTHARIIRRAALWTLGRDDEIGTI